MSLWLVALVLATGAWIAGPVLVLYHSTLKVGSLNAAVAFYSMLVVAFGATGRRRSGLIVSGSLGAC